ncbi:MAG: hypothetical protein D3911_07970 [Candidatus Electrothrix sp. AW3_4]|nr:hypothetical protein [Candidatus Electrothrix gigas]
MKNITISQLRKELSGKSEKELTDEIVNLFKKIPQVKEYYTVAFSAEGEEHVLEKYKDIITHEFFPKRGYGKARLSVAKKAISDFKKISDKPHLIVDIMLHYVEEGVNYTAQYGDINEPFYNSMEKMFEDALEIAKKHNELSQFQELCEELVSEACQGWGFQDGLNCIYDEFYDNSTPRK